MLAPVIRIFDISDIKVEGRERSNNKGNMAQKTYGKSACCG